MKPKRVTSTNETTAVGLRYCETRPFLVVRKPHPIASEPFLVQGVLANDGKTFFVQNAPPALNLPPWTALNIAQPLPPAAQGASRAATPEAQAETPSDAGEQDQQADVSKQAADTACQNGTQATTTMKADGESSETASRRKPPPESLDGALRLRGSVAAIVRDDPDIAERYFLTCHHVASLSLLDPDLNARLPGGAGIRAEDYLGVMGPGLASRACPPLSIHDDVAAELIAMFADGDERIGGGAHQSEFAPQTAHRDFQSHLARGIEPAELFEQLPGFEAVTRRAH